MSGVATSHFQELLGTPVLRPGDLNLDALNPPAVDLSDLEIPFSEAEILEVIKSMPADKAPGPDEFSARFYQVCWPLIKDTVMKTVTWFDSADGWGFDRVNDAFITLLPKHESVVDIGEFRRINLIHSFAKIISKAMATRLAKPFPQLVDCNQSAFI
jgi:hypothetical protein